MEFKHIPVLYEEIMTLMDAKPDNIVVDCTLGITHGLLRKLRSSKIMRS